MGTASLGTLSFGDNVLWGQRVEVSSTPLQQALAALTLSRGAPAPSQGEARCFRASRLVPLAGPTFGKSFCSFTSFFRSLSCPPTAPSKVGWRGRGMPGSQTVLSPSCSWAAAAALDQPVGFIYYDEQEPFFKDYFTRKCADLCVQLFFFTWVL